MYDLISQLDIFNFCRVRALYDNTHMKVFNSGRMCRTMVTKISCNLLMLVFLLTSQFQNKFIFKSTLLLLLLIRFEDFFVSGTKF